MLRSIGKTVRGIRGVSPEKEKESFAVSHDFFRFSVRIYTQLHTIPRTERETHPDGETDGHGADALHFPPWT